MPDSQIHVFRNLYGVCYAPPIFIFHTVSIRTTTSLVGGLCACIIYSIQLSFTIATARLAYTSRCYYHNSHIHTHTHTRMAHVYFYFGNFSISTNNLLLSDLCLVVKTPHLSNHHEINSFCCCEDTEMIN